MSSDATIVSGRRVAERYRLVEQRSHGAWTAVDETLRRNVVVHLLPASADAAAKDHFTNEARSLARLNHRNIVCTYDTGVDGDGTSYRVDELAGDAPLALDSIPHEARVSYATQIIRAIADAHDAGLVHGDLGSSSVLVDDTGRVQLRGVHLPADGELAATKQADVAALAQLIIALAPSTASPLRDVAVAWRRTPPTDARSMLAEVVAIPDDVLATIPPRNRPPVTGAPETPRHNRAVFIVTVATLVIAAVVVAVVLPATKSKNNFGGPLQDLHVTAKSFDPQGKPPTEFENLARLALDKNPGTAWKTEHYRSAQFGNLKNGVGLILQADGASQFETLTISTPTKGWTVQVYVAEQPATSLAGWGQPVAGTKIVDTPATLGLEGAKGGAVLIWITDLGPSRQVRINEATLSGRLPS